MNEDTLARAARAVRDSYGGSSAKGEATRRSILARATIERRRRRKIVAYVVPLAAVLALSTAWAAIGGRLPWRLEGTGGTSSKSAHATPPGLRAPPPDPTSLPEAPPPAPARVTPADGEPAPSGAPAAVPRAPDRVQPRPPAPPAPAPSIVDAEGSLYAQAHRRHFVDHDPAKALEGWDAYLAAYPDGRFALEARYNRALTLVRLERRQEARAALAPFADGTYGGYRQREAEGLLSALGGE